MNSAPVEIISAPTILGLKPLGTEFLADRLLDRDLAEKVSSPFPVFQLQTFNEKYSNTRHPQTGCLNPEALQDFSLGLATTVVASLQKGHFPIVLGGDCSILIGAMAAMKRAGDCGLIFFDAHADFYLPHQSITGEVADMDLSIVTGGAPEMLNNLNGTGPYVRPENVIHLGQRDELETKKYNSQDIRNSRINCISLGEIRDYGILKVKSTMLELIKTINSANFWMHFDTDVIDDELNPAVDYRLPGGLTFSEFEELAQCMIDTGKISGLSVSGYNPTLDHDGSIAKNIVKALWQLLG